MDKVNHIEEVDYFGNRVQIHYQEIIFDKGDNHDCIVPKDVKQMLLELKFDNASDAKNAYNYLFYLKGLDIDEMKLC